MRQERELLDLLEMKRPCIWIRTIEEASLLKELLTLLPLKYSANNIYTWSLTTPLQKVQAHLEPENIVQTPAMDAVFNHIRVNKRECRERKTKAIDIYILKDLHMIIDKPNAIRSIRDLVEDVNGNKDYYFPLIAISPELNIPPELEHLFSVIDFKTPTKNEIAGLISATSSKLVNKGYAPILSTKSSKLVDAFYGLTSMEIKNIIAESIKKEKTLKLEYIIKSKIKAIKNTGLLDYKIPSNALKDIGGNDTFKSWVEEVKYCMAPEARDFGLARPKGYLALGLPGK